LNTTSLASAKVALSTRPGGGLRTSCASMDLRRSIGSSILEK
jgi:hypothetical protein